MLTVFDPGKVTLPSYSELCYRPSPAESELEKLKASWWVRLGYWLRVLPS